MNGDNLQYTLYFIVYTYHILMKYFKQKIFFFLLRKKGEMKRIRGLKILFFLTHFHIQIYEKKEYIEVCLIDLN